MTDADPPLFRLSEPRERTLRGWPWFVGKEDEEAFRRRWPTLHRLLTADSREEKIEALIADPAATEGEREAARLALERIRG